jgi:Rod binding domain-containing protein
MADLGSTPLAVAPQLLAGPAVPGSVGELAKRAQIRETAQKFEASFLSSMLQPMFDSVETDSLFGGGPGETMFRSFLTDAMGKQMARSGGVGLSASVEREMLKMQGLT